MTPKDPVCLEKESLPRPKTPRGGSVRRRHTEEGSQTDGNVREKTFRGFGPCVSTGPAAGDKCLFRVRDTRLERHVHGYTCSPVVVGPP